MDDLIAFLNARLNEDHWEAFKFHRDCQWDAEMLARLFRMDGSDPIVHHVARHDPARALREVAAGRKLVTFALENAEQIDGEWGDGHHAAEIASGQCADHGMEAAVKVLGLLAAIWSDHPDYRPEWKLTAAS